MTTITVRLAAMGLALPRPAAPVANYIAGRRHGDLVVVSEQICFAPGGQLAARHKGKLGRLAGPVA